MNYEDKFIAFVDILGFKNIVERSQHGGAGAPTVEWILELIKAFGSSHEEEHAPDLWRRHPGGARCRARFDFA